MKTTSHTKITIVSLFILSLLSCANGKKTTHQEMTFAKKHPFTIQNIFFQKWVSGIETGGKGITFQFTISDLEEGVVIKDVYFREMKATPQLSPSKKGLYTVNFMTKKPKRDIIMDSDPVKEAQNTPQEQFPFQLAENEAVINVDDNGKLVYIKLSNISEKPIIALPKANINNSVENY